MPALCFSMLCLWTADKTWQCATCTIPESSFPYHGWCQSTVLWGYITDWHDLLSINSERMSCRHVIIRINRLLILIKSLRRYSCRRIWMCLGKTGDREIWCLLTQGQKTSAKVFYGVLYLWNLCHFLCIIFNLHLPVELEKEYRVSKIAPDKFLSQGCE